jgi:hypothetical protein
MPANQKKIYDFNKKQSYKNSLKKLSEKPGFNQSFFTTKNIYWYNYAINWLPNKKKPLVFLPCANADKTRKEFGKKMFSHSTTHQFLSEITRCNSFERVVISEPLTIVPYALEGQHPDYNIPPQDLSIQSEYEFIIRLANWLNIVKRKQIKRKYIYYIGSTHHYFVLKFANKIAKNPFKIIYEIPAGGTKSYGTSAKFFKQVIIDLEENSVKPILKKISLEKHIKSRNRYTNKQFWEYINTLKNISKNRLKPQFTDNAIPVASQDEYYQGFSQIYPINNIKKIDITLGLDILFCDFFSDDELIKSAFDGGVCRHHLDQDPEYNFIFEHIINNENNFAKFKLIPLRFLSSHNLVHNKGKQSKLICTEIARARIEHLYSFYKMSYNQALSRDYYIKLFTALFTNRYSYINYYSQEMQVWSDFDEIEHNISISKNIIIKFVDRWILSKEESGNDRIVWYNSFYPQFYNLKYIPFIQKIEDYKITRLSGKISAFNEWFITKYLPNEIFP